LEVLPQVREYCDKGMLEFGLVHWASLGKAIGAFPLTFQMWLSKFASGHLAVAVTMFRWKCWDSELCPLCHQANETMSHVLFCPHPTSTNTWMQQLGQLCHWMSQSDTAPAIQHCLLSTIEHCNCRSFRSFADQLCQRAAHDQDQIRLFGIMVGRVAYKWIDIQSLHYSEIGSPRSATLWLHCLCRQLILFSHAMWLSRNQQVQEFLHQQEHCSLRSAICNQF